MRGGSACKSDGPARRSARNDRPVRPERTHVRGFRGERKSTPMKIILALAAFLAIPLALQGGPVLAASAHNIQAGTHTSNAYDTQASEVSKQQQQR